MNSQSTVSLADEIDRSRHEAGGVAIWYIGQVGFLLQHRGLTIAIDPYLSYSVDKLDGFPKDFWVRAYAPPILPDQLGHVDLVLCTHDHLDHADPETLLAIAKASPACRFAGPKVTVEELKKAGMAADRLIVLNEGQPFPFRDLVVEPIAAAHEEYETDKEGFHRYLSYLLQWNGITLFHAGDTIATPQLSAALAGRTIDVAFLPINGGDDERRKIGVVGNMDAASAARFAKENKISLAVPTHYDLYPNNGADAADFVAALEAAPAAKTQYKIFQPGERFLSKAK